jgi:hypothetical protein
MMTDDERLLIVLLVVSISNYNYDDDKTMRFEIPIELLAILICIFSFAATSYIIFALYRAKYYSTAAGYKASHNPHATSRIYTTS